MKRGIIAGKFLPPHAGHSYLIDSAAQQCDQLTVLICDRPEYLIPAQLRQQWLRELHPEVEFIIIPDTLDDDDSAGWAAATIKLLGYTPDCVFSSEAYGASWAQHMDAANMLIDLPRRKFPISGTAVRDDPWANWRYLAEPVRGYFAKRICVVGSESSGTTTLTKALAKHYQTNWVPEYGRQYNIDNLTRLDSEGWQTADFVEIAKEQNCLEDAAARTANKILFCDTDSFATSIWHQRYLGTRSYQVEALAAGRRYDLYLLTDANIPFEQDGIRDGEHLRQWMQQAFIDKLTFWGKPFVLMTGSKTERLDQATAIIDSLMADSAVQIPHLQRNHWQAQGGF